MGKFSFVFVVLLVASTGHFFGLSSAQASDDRVIRFNGYTDEEDSRYCQVEIVNDPASRRHWIGYSVDEGRSFTFEQTKPKNSNTLYAGKYSAYAPGSGGFGYRVPAEKSNLKITITVNEGKYQADVSGKSCIKKFLFWSCKKQSQTCTEQ